KPFSGETEMVLEPLLRWVISRLLGEADRVKSGAAGALTVRVSVVVLVRVPEAPVTVTLTVPVVAVGLAVSVSVLDVVVGFGSKAAGSEERRVGEEWGTLPVKPLRGETVMVLEPLLPWVTATLLGEADRVKSGAAWAFTVSVSVAVLVRVPEAPVTVTLTVPVVAVGLAVSVSVLDVVVGFGSKAAVTPLGRLEADNWTLPLKPF